MESQPVYNVVMVSERELEQEMMHEVVRAKKRRKVVPKESLAEDCFWSTMLAQRDEMDELDRLLDS